MPWHEVSSGRFERPLGFLETFFKTIADAGVPIKREHWCIRICCTFSIHDTKASPISLIGNAWKIVRYDHPDIASSADGFTKIYEVPDSNAVTEWLSKTLVVISESQTAEDLAASFEPNSLPMLYFLPHTSQILLQISHWRIDALGAMNLMSNLLKAMASGRTVSFGDEGKNLVPPLDDLAKFNLQAHPEAEASATNLIMQYGNGLPTIGLSCKTDTWAPESTRHLSLTLDSRLTSCIIKKCAEKNFTVTAGVHAAIIQALQQQGATDAKKYTSWGVFDFRPYVASPFTNHSRYACSVNIVGLPLSLTPSTFIETAISLKEIWAQLKDSEKRERLLTYYALYQRKACEMISQPPPPAAGMAPTAPMLQSLGIIDDHLGRDYYGEAAKVHVEDHWLGVETLTPETTFYLWTWGGEMVFNVCYNEAFYKKSFVEEFLQKVKGILLEELEISDA